MFEHITKIVFFWGKVITLTLGNASYFTIWLANAKTHKIDDPILKRFSMVQAIKSAEVLLILINLLSKT